MTAPPFQNTLILTESQQRTLALAGVFQACQLVHMIACGQTVYSANHQSYPFMVQCLHSSLNIPSDQIEHKNPLLYWQQLSSLKLGLTALENAISQPYQTMPKGKFPSNKSLELPLAYTTVVLHLSKRLYKNQTHIQHITASQQHIIKHLSFFDYDYTHQNIINNLANCYKETASTLKPRILVKGQEDILRNPAHADRIRAMLFTALQNAHLWRALGGNLWQYIFVKHKILQDVRDLLKLDYQQQNLEIKD